MAAATRLYLYDGPADTVRERRPEWTITDLAPDALMPDQPPDHVWLCRLQWPQAEWRVRLHPEPLRGQSALYWLERERDDTPKQTTNAAYVYSHVPDSEVEEYLRRAASAVQPDPGSSTQP